MINVAVVVVNRKMKTKLSLSCTFSPWIFCSTSWWGLLLLLSTPLVRSVPLNIDGPSREVANNSLTEFDSSAISKGCRYKALFYTSGDEVSTDEPCLACQCKGTVVVCKLRICPEIQVPPPPGCIVVHKAKSCCSQLICHGQETTKKISREQRFPINVSNETLFASVNDTQDSGYCILDGTVYAEGSAMRSSTLCQYCFCIRGEMKCSSPQCVIPLKGCNPRFRSYACCPTNYDCGQSNETAILKTMPSSTQVPQFLKGCLVNGQFVPEGEPVLPMQLAGASKHVNMSTGMGATESICQTCFCMGGVVHCRPLECDQPIDGCTPIKEDGHCCPDRYDCTKPHEDVTTSTVMPSSSFTMTTNLPSSSSYGTTLRTTTEEIVTRALAASRKHEEAPVMTTLQDLDNEEMTTSSSNDDSFERVAVITSGSSEESTLATPFGHRQRISWSGGFKNRSDLGSREERRSKDGDELTPRQQSSEDDERDEGNYPMFDTTTMSFEELGGVTSFEDSTEPSTTMYSDIEHDGVDMDDVETTMPNTFSPDATTGNYISWQDHGETTFRSFPDDVHIYHDDDEQGSPQQPTTVVTDESNESTSPFSTSSSASAQSSEMSSPTQSDVDYTSTSVPISTTSDSNGNLEFIPFGVEDAVVPTGSNDTLLPIIEPTSIDNHWALAHNPNLSLLKPLELKFINGTEEPLLAEGSHETENIDAALPILVERDEDADTDNEKQYQINNSQSISTSLYNNGYYPHGSIIQDDGNHPDELFVQQGELNQREHDNLEHSQPERHYTMGSTSTHPTISSTLSTARSTTKRPEQPLKAISSIDKFIPSYSPATVQPGPPKPPSNPSRTYSKFGIQDSPLYRYDHNAPGSSGFGGALIAQGQTPSSIPAPTPTQQIYHHRYYNEPEEIPTSRVNNPYNYYNIENKPHRGGGGQGIGMLPQLYKNNNQFFYEDSSAALDSYEDEYESYIQTTGSNTLLPKPTSSTGPHHYVSTKPTSSTPRTKAPISTVPTQSQFLGERVRLPSYNQQRATSTPKYKYAYINNRHSVQSKLTTERTAITTNADLKQHAPFPFNLPKTQDSSLYNLGIKLSGCNVVGKMYSVGDIIEELSSACVRCMCSHIGVHCAERSC